LHGQLGRGQAKRLARLILTNTGNFQDDASRAHRRYPVIDAPLTGTHAGLGGTLGDRPIREDADPDLTATAHVAHDGATGSLNLAAGDVVSLQALQAVGAERHRVAALSLTFEAAALQLAVLNTLWHQHSRFSIYVLRYVFHRVVS